jgi:hypothetical protein
MSKYNWEAYCLFKILHDEHLYLDIIPNINGLALISSSFGALETCRKKECKESHLKNGEYLLLMVNKC